jgi:hypothetical protein
LGFLRFLEVFKVLGGSEEFREVWRRLKVIPRFREMVDDFGEVWMVLLD